MAVCESCPQACITPGFCEAKGRPVCSTMGKRVHVGPQGDGGPLRRPRIRATTPWWATPVFSSSTPIARNRSATLAAVRCSRLPSSGMGVKVPPPLDHRGHGLAGQLFHALRQVLPAGWLSAGERKHRDDRREGHERSSLLRKPGDSADSSRGDAQLQGAGGRVCGHIFWQRLVCHCLPGNFRKIRHCLRTVELPAVPGQQCGAWRSLASSGTRSTYHRQKKWPHTPAATALLLLPRPASQFRSRPVTMGR